MNKNTRKNKYYEILSLLAACALTLYLSGCGKTSEDKVQATYSSLYTKMFSQKCVECHQAGGQANQTGSALDFSTAATGYSTMYHVAVSGASSSSICSGAQIVGTSTTSSYLLGIFFTDYGQGQSNWNSISTCTPYDHTTFATSIPSDDEKSALVTWISQGAANN